MRYTLVGVNGNAHAIMAYVRQAMRREGRPMAECKDYTQKAMSGDYNHLLTLSIDILDKLNEEHK